MAAVSNPPRPLYHGSAVPAALVRPTAFHLMHRQLTRLQADPVKSLLAAYIKGVDDNYGGSLTAATSASPTPYNRVFQESGTLAVSCQTGIGVFDTFFTVREMVAGILSADPGVRIHLQTNGHSPTTADVRELLGSLTFPAAATRERSPAVLVSPKK